MFLHYVILILLLILPVQVIGQLGTEGYGKEAIYYDTDDPSFRRTANTRYNFWFDIPKEWKAIDKSETGDGYYIVVGDDNVDMRIYGSQKVFSDSEYFKMLLGEGGKLTEFKFRDGALGNRVQTEGSVYFIRTEPDIRITLYIGARGEWLNQKKGIVEKVAKSIRLGTQN